MTYSDWWTARRLLFEERFGIHLRRQEREEREEADRLSAQYRKSAALLKQQQIDKLE